MLPRLPGLRAVQEEEQRMAAYDEEVSCRLARGRVPARAPRGDRAGRRPRRAVLPLLGGGGLVPAAARGRLGHPASAGHDRHASHGALRAARPVRPELLLQAALRAQALPGAGAARVPLRARPAPRRASRAARPPGRAAARAAQPGERGAPGAERRAGARRRRRSVPYHDALLRLGGTACVAAGILLLRLPGGRDAKIRKGDRVVVRGTHTKLDGKKGKVVRVLKQRRRAVVRFDSRARASTPPRGPASQPAPRDCEDPQG